MCYPILGIIAFSIIIGHMLLILLSVKWFNNITLNYNNIVSTSKDFSNIYIKAKDEVVLLHKEMRELVTLNTKKEQGISQMTFHLDEMQTCIKMLLDEFREFASSSNTAPQTKEQE